MPTVLAFGTFDQFHDGHAYVLARAAELGDRLVVAVARDAHVRTLKNKEPRQPEADRLARVAAQPGVGEAILSDEELGSYSVLARVSPDLVALGHDQIALRDDLRRWLAEQGRELEIVMIGKIERNV